MYMNDWLSEWWIRFILGAAGSSLIAALVYPAELLFKVRDVVSYCNGHKLRNARGYFMVWGSARFLPFVYRMVQVETASPKEAAGREQLCQEQAPQTMASMGKWRTGPIAPLAMRYGQAQDGYLLSLA